MAYASAEISADELSMHNSDRPFLVGSHVLRDAFAPVSTPPNPWTQTGASTDSDASASGFPAYRAWDGFAHKLTKPSSSQNDWYYVADLGLAGYEFDCALLVFDSSPSKTVKLQVADNAAFSSNLVTLATWAAASSYGHGTGRIGRRLAHADLGGSGSNPLRYSNVRYVRVHVTNAAATIQPEINELWLGRRRNMRFFSVPLGNKAESSKHVGAYGAGSWTGTTHYKGAASRDYGVNIRDSADRGELLGWWRETLEGTRNFLLMEDSSTAPEAYLMTLDDPRFNPRLLDGQNLSMLNLSMSEHAPHASGF